MKQTKKYGLWYWDTFDNHTILVGEADSLEETKEIMQNKYGDRLFRAGADQIDIVDLNGNVVHTEYVS